MNTLKRFKCKFFGSRERKGQITQQTSFVTTYDRAMVEDVLRNQGWVKINGLKIRECEE
jgi:hypothetical protein